MTTFTGRDCTIEWKEYVDAPGDELQNEKQYRIEFTCATTTVVKYVGANANYGTDTDGYRQYRCTLTYQENLQAGLTRTPVINVYTQDAWGDWEAPALTVDAVNPQSTFDIAAPTISATEVGAHLTLTQPSDTDVAGYVVYMDTTNPPAHTAGKLVYDGPNTSITLTASDALTRYVQVAPYDAFGKDSLTYSSVLSFNKIQFTDGQNTAQVMLYKRSVSTPARPTVTTTYTFSTGVLSGADNGWTQAPPVANGNPLYVTVATVMSQTDTDTIAAAEWASPVILVQDGTSGADGLNSASVFLYQRKATVPSVPSVNTTYTFSTGTATGFNNGWAATVPTADGNPLYVTTATAASTTDTDTIASTEWATPHIMAQDGSDGPPGSNNATVFLYQRKATVPSVPSATTTYTFATSVLTGINNGWTQAVPTGSNPLYVTAAVASSSGTTDTIAASEWATPVIMAQDGATGTNGTSNAQVWLYQRKATAPSVPSATCTFTFSTGVLSGINNGWSQTIPAYNGIPLYLTSAEALAVAGATTDTIATGEWASPVIIVEDWTTVTGPGKPEDNATNSHVYRQATPPANPTLHDIWVDTASVPHILFSWDGSIWVQVSRNLINQDNLDDGTIYGRTLLNRLNAGRPWIDFNDTFHLNQTQDYIGDGATYVRMPGATTTGTGASRRALIDFSQTHLNKSLANVDPTADTKLTGIAAGATLGATWGTDVGNRPIELTDGRVATGLNSGGFIDFTRAHVGKGALATMNIATPSVLPLIEGSNIFLDAQFGVGLNTTGGPWNASGPSGGVSPVIVTLPDSNVSALAVPAAIKFPSAGAPTSSRSKFQYASATLPAYSGLNYFMRAQWRFTAGFNGKVTMQVDCYDSSNTFISGKALTGMPDYTGSALGSTTNVTASGIVPTLPAGTTMIRPFFQITWGSSTPAGDAYMALPELRHTAGNITYNSGATVESLRPAEAGAEVTTGKSIDLLVDGATYSRMPVVNTTGTGTARRALIDFSQTHLNKSLANVDPTADTKLTGIAAGATVGGTWGVDIGGRPTYLTDGRVGAGLNASGGIDFTNPGHTNKSLANVDSGADTKLTGIEAGATVGARSGTNLYASDGSSLSDALILNDQLTLIGDVNGGMTRVRLSRPGASGFAGVTLNVEDGATLGADLSSNVTNVLPKWLPATTSAGGQFKFTGHISYTSTSTSATISVAAGSLLAGSSISYNAMSVSVTGNGVVTYYLYVNSNCFTAGAHTLHSSTSTNSLVNDDNVVFIGQVTVTYTSGGGGSGTGGGGGAIIGCVTADTILPGYGRADTVRLGDELQIANPVTFRERLGVVTKADAKFAPCVRIRTESGIELDCSRDAPIGNHHGGLVLAPNLVGMKVTVCDHGEYRHEYVVDVTDLGLRKIIHITCENDLFLAGKEEGRYLLHHNDKP